MRTPSASKLDLASHCRLWLDETQIPVLPEDPPGEAAVMGKAFHACAERYINGLGTAPHIVADALPLIEPKHARAEICYGYNPETGYCRELGAGLEYAAIKQHKDEGLWVCVVDVVGGDLNAGHVDTRDHKTGQPRVPAADSEQLRMGAFCASSVHGVNEATAAFDYIGPDGHISVEPTVFGRAALDEFPKLVDRIRADTHPVGNPGNHCSNLFCPALTVCRPVAKMVESIVPVDNLTRAIQERPGEAVHALSAAKQMVRKFEDRLKAVADSNGGIHGDDGKVWSGKDHPVKASTIERKAHTQRRYQWRKAV
jgi:hypothetical protein